MKRLVFISLVSLIAAAVFFGDRMLATALDSRLAPLLTRELGLPVHLDPIKARVIGLRATSARLIMGDPNDPAVVAENVMVRISWPALLKREIRLASASATDLMVRPSRWPSSGEPLPDNYQFLDPWLPNRLKLDAGRYLDAQGSTYPITEMQWRRKLNGGASLQLSKKRIGSSVAISADLGSLQELLQLAPITMDLNLEADEKEQSRITAQLTLQPGNNTAYELQAHIQAAGMQTHVIATGATPWQLPGQSKTTIDKLDVQPVRDLISSYSGPNVAQDTSELLANPLPRLDLPTHQGQVSVATIRHGDEAVKDTRFDFSASEQGLKINSATGAGPSGIFDGKLGIDSSAEGWVIALDATMRARQDDGGIAEQLMDSDWLWQTGNAKLHGKGQTWGELLNFLEGDITLAGHYKDETKKPVKIEGQLDNQPGIFALEHLTIAMGDARLRGSVALSGSMQRKLTLNLTGEHIALDFLGEDGDAKPLPGIEIPEYLNILPGVDLDLKIDITDLSAPGISLAKAQATLQRKPGYGKLIAHGTGSHAGTIDLTLEASLPPGEPGDMHLTIDFEDLDIPDLFEQQVLLHSRSTGKMTFRSQGREWEDIFKAMDGQTTMAINIRADNNWQRASEDEEKLAFSGNSRFVIDKKRILGITIAKLDIDSTEQDLTGDISMVAARNPWLIAELESETLNVTGLLELLPESSEEADQADLLDSMRQLGAAQVSLNVDSLILEDTPLSKLSVKVASGEDIFQIKQLDFTSHGSKLASEGTITWQDGDRAKLQGSATLANVNLDQFLIRSPDSKYVPVSGTARLTSEGSKITELVGNITGHIDLQASADNTQGAVQARRSLVVMAKRLPDGVQADIEALQWGESDLAGSIRFRHTSPPELDIEITQGTLSLLPWEKAHSVSKSTVAKEKASSRIGSTAKASADFVGHALLAPVRLFTGGDNKGKKGKLFSAEAMPLDSMNAINVNLKGRMDALVTTVVTLEELSFSGALQDGKLTLDASTKQFSQGQADATLALDSTVEPPSLQFTTHFSDVRGLSGENTYTRSGFVSVQSQGHSPAELAAAANGLAYLELGPGHFDYANSTLLTADLASTMFSTLIPGIEKQDPTLECGVTVALLKDGLAATPYGFAARTNYANLLGGMEVDLAKEKLQMNFSSRSRRGVGLSVGNVFSNTIRIRGSLTDPRIVPNATGIAWRSWAAFMTAGLSVIGESVVKRVLASDNPCKSIKTMIAKELCVESEIAAASPMVCAKT